MTIDSKTVKHLSFLCRIDMNEQQCQDMSGKVNQILGWVEMLDEVDTKDVQPLYSVIENQKSERDDLVTQKNTQEDVLKNAPKPAFGFYSVPKVVE